MVREAAESGSTLARVNELTSAIREWAPRIDAERKPPPELIDALRTAGCFRMMAPRQFGGDELPLPAVLQVIDTLARADGTVGWLVAQATLAQLVLVHLPVASITELYASGPDLLAAGAFAPKGRAIRDEGGWRVTGRWPFATGADQAAWVYVQCIVVENRKFQIQENGLPLTRVALFPAREVAILDTWRALGLRGTSSHDVELHNVFCPEAHSCSLNDPPSLKSPIFRIQLIDYGCLFVAAVASGVARGALDDIIALAADGKRPAFSRQRLAESTIFQDRLGETFMTQRGASALLAFEAEQAWAAALAEQALPMVERAALRATSAQVTSLATRAVDVAHALGGGSSVYETSALQRRLRDIHTATQHAWNGHDTTTLLGAVLAGEPVDPTLFR